MITVVVEIKIKGDEYTLLEHTEIEEMLAEALKDKVEDFAITDGYAE